MTLQRFDEYDGWGDRRPQTVLAKGSDERERPCRAFGEAADASAVDDQHGSAGLVELTIADASHDRVGAGLLTCGRFANFGSEFGEVVVGRFKDVTKFEFGAHRDLEQFRGWQIATLQFVVEIIWEIHLQAWHTPTRNAPQGPFELRSWPGDDPNGRDPVETTSPPWSLRTRLTCGVSLFGLGGFVPSIYTHIPWSGHIYLWSWGESNPKFRCGSVLICVA